MNAMNKNMKSQRNHTHIRTVIGSLFEESIDIIASDMLQAGLISRHVSKRPKFDLLINEFTSGIMFMRKADEIINHFIKFLKVLSKMKGPFVFAAKKT